MSIRKLLYLFLVGSAIAAAGGCAGKPTEWQRPKVVHASGLVRFNGQPLEGARVDFTSPTANVSAWGLTDAAGRFTLTTFRLGDGAVPGKHQVTVTKAQMPPGRTIDRSAAPVWKPGAAPKPQWLIPKQYASPQSSNLIVEIAETGADDLVVDLTPAEK